MRIDRHIFGSVHGYQTLARTDGITDADLRILEALSVGATASSSLLAALAASPAYIVLPLGNCRAVTRISVGNADDQGRPTLLQVTAAISKAQWDRVLNGDVLSLVRCRDAWQWDGQPVIQPIALPDVGSMTGTASPESAEKILAMLSLLERGISRSRPVLVREQDLSLEEFSLLERLLPPSARSGMTLVYRAFGANVPGSVVCIAKEVGIIPSDGLYRPGQPVEPSPYAQAVAQAGFQLGHIPEAFVRSHRGFGTTAQPRTSTVAAPKQAMPATVIVERMPMRMMVAMMVSCIILSSVVGFFAWWLTVRAAERVKTDAIAKVQSELKGCQDERDRATKLLSQEKAAAGELQAKHQQEIQEVRKEASTDRQKRDLKVAELQSAHALEVAGYVQQIHDVRLPVLSDGKRSAIIAICEKMVRNLPQDGEIKRTSAANLADLQKWQVEARNLEGSLKGALQGCANQQDAQAKLFQMLSQADYREFLDIVALFAILPPQAGPSTSTPLATVSAASTQAVASGNGACSSGAPGDPPPIGSIPLASANRAAEPRDSLEVLGQQIREIEEIDQLLTGLKKTLQDAQKKVKDYRDQGRGGDNATRALQDANSRLANWQKTLQTSKNSMLNIFDIEENLVITRRAARTSGNLTGTPAR